MMKRFDHTKDLLAAPGIWAVLFALWLLMHSITGLEVFI